MVSDSRLDKSAKGRLEGRVGQGYWLFLFDFRSVVVHYDMDERLIRNGHTICAIF
jgi:hypothetical protein